MSTIVDITAIPVRIPLAQPMILASEVIDHADNLIVRVCDADGAEGWGEAASAPTMTGETLRGMVEAVRTRIAPPLLGWKIEDRVGWMDAIARMTGTPAARAAVEIALHDLLGRRHGVPVWALLVGDGSRPMPIVRTLSTDFDADHIARLRALGTTHFKVKTGLVDPKVEANALCRLREAVGAQAHLSADANMAWQLDEASVFLDHAAHAALDYLEQPLSAHDMQGMRALAQRSATPLCLDEALHGPETITAYHDAGAANGAGLKLLKLGGFGGALKAEANAARCGWLTTWASKIAETSLGCAATLHAASIAADPAWGVSLTHDRLTGDLVTASLPFTAAALRAPAGPGLGVEPDPEQLLRFQSDQ